MSTDASAVSYEIDATDKEPRFPDFLINQPETAILAGWLNDANDFELFRLGAGSSGDRWLLENRTLNQNRRFVIALFDEQMSLLSRIEPDASSTTILRHDCETVFIGIWSGLSNSGGSYIFHVKRISDNPPPVPRGQVVRLNFEGVSGLDINKYRSLSFGEFDAADIGIQYADATRTIKSTLVETLRDCYADYNISILTSDDDALPEEPYTTIYFGGRGAGQLGIAEEVDPYNSDQSQNAVVFTDSFDAYLAMDLTPESLGRMIGNVAGHELGHLLGLYHVNGGEHLMCEAAGISVWEMAGPQHFGQADLDPRVFPAGRQNAPQILAETVGLCTQ